MEARAAMVGLASCMAVAGGGRCRRANAYSRAALESLNSSRPTSSVSLLAPSHHPFCRRGILGLLSALALGLSADVQQEALGVPLCEFTLAPSGLGFCDTSTGSGLPASPGMLIKANYIGKLEDGKVFDSSYDRGRPLTFKIGVGQVIKGWDEGILGGKGIPPMLAGGKRKLKIPPQLGYGERGAGCRAGSCAIPPNAVLLFDVEFVGKAY